MSWDSVGIKSTQTQGERQMTNYSHLDALQTRLSHETLRLNASKTNAEREMRQVWVNGIKREIAGEKKFLGLDKFEAMSDDQLLAELSV